MTPPGSNQTNTECGIVYRNPNPVSATTLQPKEKKMKVNRLYYPNTVLCSS